jgi:hypothetical protein
MGKSGLIPFETSPFPYRGEIPDKGKPFLDAESGDRRGHTSPRGGIYWEEPTYSDRRVLLSIPKTFDPDRPFALVVYFHGNQARLDRDVERRQQVPRQVAESGLNAVLVAPQFAVDALDSSAGRFWEPGTFARFLDEAAERLAKLSEGKVPKEALARAPVLIVAYSGGYLPAAYSLAVGGANGRVEGVILLDALYAEADKFEAWAGRRGGFFVSAYSASTRSQNLALQRALERRAGVGTGLPQRIARGSVTFIPAGDVVHNDFVTRAWVANPLKAILAKVVIGGSGGEVSGTTQPADSGESTAPSSKSATPSQPQPQRGATGASGLNEVQEAPQPGPSSPSAAAPFRRPAASSRPAPQRSATPGPARTSAPGPARTSAPGPARTPAPRAESQAPTVTLPPSRPDP